MMYFFHQDLSFFSTKMFCTKSRKEALSLFNKIIQTIIFMKSTVGLETFSGEIIGHISMTKMSLQVKGHWLWFHLEKDKLCQVYLPRTCFSWMNTSLAFNPDLWGELISCIVTLWPHRVMGLMIIILFIICIHFSQ